jgi:alpha-L-arabinofuranosidase
MTATVRIDLDRRLGRVDRRLFGGFIEHLGRCIYGGVFEPGSPLSDERGFRRDVLEAARALRIPLLRWPGGNFVSGYHWTDGIGPPEQRPRRIELAWAGEESNRFGTDEFVEYCRALGAEPYICVNMGTGSMDEAQAWVEYCNGTGNTHWANLRRANGHPEPYRVRYWGLGNEMYGVWQIGSTTAEDYVKKARQFAAVMKWTDPSIELVSCGQWGWSDWDQVVIEGMAPFVRYHSIHLYTGSGNYYRNVFTAHQAERAIRICERLIERARYAQSIAQPIGIAFDEWNVWYRSRGTTHLEERYDLSDALAVATYLNTFIRLCRTVHIANLAQMVNAIAPIFTSPAGLYLQPIYHPLRLYAEHVQDVALDPLVVGPMFDLTPELEARATVNDRDWTVADMSPFSVLDVGATLSGDGHDLCVTVVNRSRDDAIAGKVDVTGRALSGAHIYEVNGPEVTSTNSFERSDVGVHEREVSLVEGVLEHTFPAHSVTVLRARLGHGR